MEEKAFSGKWDIYAIFWFALDWSNHLRINDADGMTLYFGTISKKGKRFFSVEIGVIMDMVIGLSLRASSGSVRDELNFGRVHSGM